MLETIGFGEGFWINSDNEQTLAVSGTLPIDTTSNLNIGWSLIGLKNSQTQSINPFIAGNEETIVSIWKWQNDNWAIFLPGGGTDNYAQTKGFIVLDEIKPGEGFWINCTEAIALQ